MAPVLRLEHVLLLHNDLVNASGPDVFRSFDLLVGSLATLVLFHLSSDPGMSVCDLVAPNRVDSVWVRVLRAEVRLHENASLPHVFCVPVDVTPDLGFKGLAELLDFLVAGLLFVVVGSLHSLDLIVHLLPLLQSLLVLVLHGLLIPRKRINHNVRCVTKVRNRFDQTGSDIHRVLNFCLVKILVQFALLSPL